MVRSATTRCVGCNAPVATSADPWLVQCPGCGGWLRVDLVTAVAVPEWTDACPCSKKKCARHGRCRECHVYHHDKNDRLPRCLRKTATRLAGRAVDGVSTRG